jgi:hypothetical protein
MSEPFECFVSCRFPFWRQEDIEDSTNLDTDSFKSLDSILKFFLLNMLGGQKFS